VKTVALACAFLVLAGCGGGRRIVPRDAHLERTWKLTGGQVLVEWRGTELVAPKGGKPYPNVLRHLVLWTGDMPFTVYAQSGPWGRVDDIRIADVTGDGRPDVLVHDEWGNHGTGPFTITATVDGRPRRILYEDRWVETSWHVAGGRLHVDRADYKARDSMCCPSGVLHLTYRWTGSRLVVARRARAAYRY
jgi:hypothetical protein